MKDKSYTKRKPGETADNHRDRLFESAPHLAKKLSPKGPGFHFGPKVHKTGEPHKMPWPKVKGTPRNDD